MEKVKISGLEQVYPIISICPIAEHILQIIFADAKPAEYGDIELYTDGDILATTLIGWNTVYQEDGQAIYLSDDGSVYIPKEDLEPIFPSESYEPYEPTLEERKMTKKQEMSRGCEKAIYAGVDVTFLNGSVEHFSLTEHDQLNLFGKQAQLAAGASQLEYHSDGNPCQYYCAADMQEIIQAAMWHVSYHTTYCNALNMWITGCDTAEELQEIFYGAAVPDKYQSEVFQAYLIKSAEMMGDDTNESEAGK